MSMENEVLESLAANPAIITLLGSSGKIMIGSLEKKLPLAPPLLLVEVLKGIPEIVGEEGVIVDSWTCTVTLPHRRKRFHA